MRRKIEAEVRAKLTDEFLANFLLANDDDEDDAKLLRFGASGSVELSDGWQETLNSAIDREIDAAKRIAEKQFDTTVRNRVANSQPRQVSSEDLVPGQVDRTLVRTALFVSLPFNKNDGRTADIDPVYQGRLKPGK
jgi:hypothetical protein